MNMELLQFYYSTVEVKLNKRYRFLPIEGIGREATKPVTSSSLTHISNLISTNEPFGGICVYASFNAVDALEVHSPCEKQNQPFQLSFNASLKSISKQEHCTLTEFGCTLSVGREVKMEIPAKEKYHVRRHSPLHFSPKDSAEIDRRIREDFVPIVKKAKGFVRSYWLDLVRARARRRRL